MTSSPAPIDHGGDLDRAMRLYGGAAERWIDLSTGINRTPYPVPQLSDHAWRDLPTQTDMAALLDTARRYFEATGAISAHLGAQAIIQRLPGLYPGKLMRIVGPTYNEYARVFRHAGWTVEMVETPEALAGADIAIVVTPNNPDGRFTPLAVLSEVAATTGLLVVDESFMDVTPEHSLVGTHLEGQVLTLKSFGKFFGLAGVRLGFAIGRPDICAQLSAEAGPWPVPGPAIEIALSAYADRTWAAHMRTDLLQSAQALDALMGLELRGATGLFRLYACPDAAKLQAALASVHIWTRIFPWSPHLIRIGTPAAADLPKIAARLSALKPALSPL